MGSDGFDHQDVILLVQPFHIRFQISIASLALDEYCHGLVR